VKRKSPNADFLVGAFKVSDPDEARGNKITAGEILDKGARQIKTDLAGQPFLQARLMFTIGNVYEGLGLYEPAKQMLEQATRFQKRILGPDNSETLTSQRLLARILEYQAQYSEAEKLYLDVLQRQERVLGPRHIEVLRTKTSLGTLHNEQGRYADAEKLLRGVVKVMPGTTWRQWKPHKGNAPRLSETSRRPWIMVIAMLKRLHMRQAGRLFVMTQIINRLWR
jgi:tetratricopeptide (TPR) repeat protein